MDFLKKQAASYLSSQQEGHEKPDSEKPAAPAEGHGDSSAPHAKKNDQEDVPSYQELMSSANVLLSAAKGQFGQKDEGANTEGGKPERYDSGKLAAAAEDLLDGAEHYGKLKGTPFGDYVQKAEDYLHDYQAKHGAPPPAHDRARARAAGAEDDVTESRSRDKTGQFDPAPQE